MKLVISVLCLHWHRILQDMLDIKAQIHLPATIHSQWWWLCRKIVFWSWKLALYPLCYCAPCIHCSLHWNKQEALFLEHICISCHCFENKGFRGFSVSVENFHLFVRLTWEVEWSFTMSMRTLVVDRGPGLTEKCFFKTAYFGKGNCLVNLRSPYFMLSASSSHWW